MSPALRLFLSLTATETTSRSFRCIFSFACSRMSYIWNIYDTAFPNCLLWFSNTHLSSCLLVACVHFFFIFEYLCTVWIYHNLCSLIYWRTSGLCQFGAIMDKVVTHIHAQVIVLTYISIIWVNSKEHDCSS